MFVLRNRLLGTCAILMAPDNEGGAGPLTPEQEREAINVEVGTDKTKEANKDNNEENEENDDNLCIQLNSPHTDSFRHAS